MIIRIFARILERKGGVPDKCYLFRLSYEPMDLQLITRPSIYLYPRSQLEAARSSDQRRRCRAIALMEPSRQPSGRGVAVGIALGLTTMPMIEFSEHPAGTRAVRRLLDEGRYMHPGWHRSDRH